MESQSLKGTPCEGAIARALGLAREIVAGDAEPIKGAREIAWLGSGDCYDFLNEIDVVSAMGGFWSLVDSLNLRHFRVITSNSDEAQQSDSHSLVGKRQSGEGRCGVEPIGT